MLFMVILQTLYCLTVVPGCLVFGYNLPSTHIALLPYLDAQL